MLTLDRAKALLNTTATEEQLLLHAKKVKVAAGGLAKQTGGNEQHRMVRGHLHDYDCEQHPEEQLHYTGQPLKDAGLTKEDVRAALAHGYDLCNDAEPMK